MSTTPRASVLAPFQVRSFRFQWPADLATSWAFEMETLILGWYVLVETGSVLLLTVFGALQYLGSLLAPMFGAVGDRIGHRSVLCATRATYAALAASLMTFAFIGVLTPVHVFIIATLAGIIRPSDLVMRNALIGQTMPPDQLMGAMSVSRTTMDSARIAGALAGAGMVAVFGMGPAYVVIASLYAASFVLTLGVAGGRARTSMPGVAGAPQRPSPWREVGDGIAYVWTKPELLAGMCIAFLVNLTAYPMFLGLLPYVAKEIYRVDQTGLGYMAASFAFGGLLGSVALSTNRIAMRTARMTIIFSALWYVAILWLAQTQSMPGGIAVLILAGFAQSLCLTPLAVVLLRSASAQYRGRVMGVRMLAVWGLPLGLLVAGPLIARIGYMATATLYAVIGLVFIVLIAVRWRGHLWRLEAVANAR